MASALAQQLARLEHGEPPRQGSKPSLLYDEQQAAETDVATIHQLACGGYAELCRTDARFEAFAKPLFAKASAELNRELQDADANARLDTVLEAYLRLLGAYFLLPAATRTLEYLVRRFRVHEYNVDAAVMCALPYHATTQFVRLLQVLQLEGTRWVALSAVKAQGAPPSREALVRCFARDSSLLALVSDAALATAAPSARVARGGTTTFFTLLVSETVASMTRVPEDVLPRILPFVHAGLDKGATLDHHAGALLVISQLASRLQLARPLTEALLVAVAKASRAPLEPHTLQALLQLARTQSATTLPAHAVTYIAKLPRLPQLLADLSRHFSITALLQPLVCAFADRLGAHQMYHAVLLALVQDVVTDSCADALACRLILVAGLGAHGSQAADAAPSAAAASSAAKVLRALHCRWPAEVSRATSQALQQAQMRGIEQPLVAFLRDALAGTTSQPLQGDVCVTLGDGLAHESGRVREAALRDLTRSWQCTESTNGAVPADLARFERLRDALLRCVCDADAQVRMAALSVPGLADVVSDDAALFRAGAEALVASARTVRDTKATVGKVGVHRAIMKQALKLLCSTLPLRAPALRDSSARLLLGFVVGVRELQSAAQVARSLASSLGHHVFGDFRAQTCPTGDGAKDVAAAQRRVLSALGDALCSTATPEPLSWLQASWSDLSLDGQHTVLCALLRALSRSSADATAAGTLALAACNLLLDEPARLQAYSDAFADSRFEWEAGLPCAAYLDAWAPDDAAFAAVLRRKLMLDAIGLLPVVPVEDSTDGLGVFGDLFATLCSATASAPVLQPHVDAVLARAAARFSSRSLFLCLLSSACPSLVSEAAQVTALELLRSESDCEAGVPHVVVALTSPRRVVRKAAVDFLLATSSKADTVPGRKQTAKRSAQTSKMTDARSSLVAWAAEHGSSVVAGDCTTALPLLRAKLSAESAAPLRDSMLRLLKNSSGLPAYALVRALDVLRGAGSDEGVCAAVIPIWDSIRTLPLLGSEPLTQAAALICSMLASNIAARNDAAPAAGAALLSGLQNAVPAPVRVGALEAITPPVHAAMSASYQDLLLASCALFLSREEHQSCRDAARALLDRVPLDGLSFVRVLESTCASVNGRAIAQPAAKRRTAGDALPLLPCDAQPLEVLTAVLEVLSWKEVEDGEQLALAVENAASFLLDAVSAASSQERVEASDESADASGDADETGRPALEYCVHLTLRVLTLFVEGAVRDNAACARIALRALREVMEAGVHGAALELLTTIATVTPDCVVANVLDVIQTLTSKATSDISGRGSVKALGEAFRAIAGCWTLARDDDGSELLQHVVASLPAMHEHQRLPLLASVLRALPSPVALSLVVQLLISHRNESDESASFHALASMLCASRSPLECLQAMSALMRRSTQPAETASAAEFAVVQLALVAGQGESSSCALSELIALGVERLQSLAEVSEQSADVRRASQCTQSLLTTVERLMSPLSFLKAVALLFESPGQRVQRRALRICLARIRGSSGNLPSAVDEHAGSALIAPLAALARCSQKSACTTRCLALETLAALVERCGQSQEFATSLLPVIPDVLSAASHAKPLVAARGLQCVAAAVMMLSTRLVPLLPGMMTAVIGVLDSDNGDVLRLCAALDTVTAMVARLDVFLSPYAQKLVHLLLSPRFVADGVRQAAATAREMLARRLPARILVGPLTSAWGDVLSSGAGLAVALLHQLTKLIDTLDAPDAAVHHEAIFAFLLRCLDTRRVHGASPALSAAALNDIEHATVAAAVALVLKLSETQFTPLLMTALEWSRARTDGFARPFAFFRLVSALADALRSVFVPFFRHLLADAVTFLEQTGENDTRPSKKSRAVTEDGAVKEDASCLAFRLRTEVVRSLRSCFLHDSMGFLDEARFNKLLQPLLAQLKLVAPKAIAPDAVADADAVIVECLVHMVQNVQQDTLWRPLNRGVLLATRSDLARPKRLGIAVVAKLVEVLAEEYLVLLPETLPFLAELMEDVDEQTEAAARQLVTTLSQLADEDVAELLRA